MATFMTFIWDWIVTKWWQVEVDLFDHSEIQAYYAAYLEVILYYKEAQTIVQQ